MSQSAATSFATVACVSGLRSAIREVTSADLRHLSDDELLDHVLELERASRALEAGRARAIAEAESRRAHDHDGFVSTTAWLRSLGVPASLAAQQVRLARALPDMPATRVAL